MRDIEIAMDVCQLRCIWLSVKLFSTIYVNQTIMPYVLNFYDDVYQSFLNNTGERYSSLNSKEMD